MARSLAERLWEKVRKSDGCWEWTSPYRSPGGYGLINRGPAGGGCFIAHRAAWLVTFGPIPDDKCVLHRCDNRLCCNPSHLFLGTRTDNFADMYAKGRYVNASSLKTHCPQGHEYTTDNTYHEKGGRKCRRCRLDRAKRAYSQSRFERGTV